MGLKESVEGKKLKGQEGDKRKVAGFSRLLWETRGVHCSLPRADVNNNTPFARRPESNGKFAAQRGVRPQ